MDIHRNGEVHKYLVHCAKNSWTERFKFLQLWGSQDPSMDLGTFLSRTQWLKALPKKTRSPRLKKQNKNKCSVKAAHKVDHFWSLTSPLSRYLLMALLRRMARPRWYSTPRKNNTKQKIKPAGTPKAMPVIWPLQTETERDASVKWKTICTNMSW